MKMHFKWDGVEKLLEEVRTAKTARDLYEQKTGKGIWLVGDHGVYLMANTSDGIHNSKRKGEEKHFVVYADECNPDMDFDTWWESKQLYYGGDDGVDFLDCEDINRMAANKPSPKAKPVALVIDLQPQQFMVEIMWRLK